MAVEFVMISEALVKSRQGGGHDRHDEMWEGVIHMREPKSVEHQRLVGRLTAGLAPPAAKAGLESLPQIAVFDAASRSTDYRIPDVVAVRPDAATPRGAEGQTPLVIEILSADDETMEKVGFYERVGVEELLVVDEVTKDLRRWVPDHGGNLVEVAAGPDRWHDLQALSVQVRGGDGTLELRFDGEVHQV